MTMPECVRMATDRAARTVNATEIEQRIQRRIEARNPVTIIAPNCEEARRIRREAQERREMMAANMLMGGGRK